MTDHESIESFLRNFFTWVYINLAIFTILLYDTLITADREFKYIWTKQWYRPTHVLYILVCQSLLIMLLYG
ncbi:hypothetical protein PNOK_0575100 [Pyrrhoderma noxium]|uniref:DUF6533 domain-containing protein n=1 Tax=Pyrrhoderma noxium TaxID=2282107 RepID=A0A286UH90_9AGAM|nr:hypothetical protein PNOK_0575100 [Pyrrhoderma noxium]